MTNELRTIFLSGQIVNLRPFVKSEIPTLVRWVNDPEIREFVAISFPQTEKLEEEWFNKLCSDTKDIVLAIETKEGVAIGSMGLHSINWVNRTATTGALIGEKEFWGKGFGTDAKMILLEYAFNTLNLRKISSEVIRYNKRSLQYSLHCGYKIEGRKKLQIFRKGKYWDLIQLGLFKEDWEPIWKHYSKTGKVR